MGTCSVAVRRMTCLLSFGLLKLRLNLLARISMRRYLGVLTLIPFFSAIFYRILPSFFPKLAVDRLFDCCPQSSTSRSSGVAGPNSPGLALIYEALALTLTGHRLFSSITYFT